MKKVIKNAILLGDYFSAPYHPLNNVEEVLSDILKDEMKVTCTEDYNILCVEPLMKYDLCICYTDCWNRTLLPEQTAGLLSYVSLGGGLLVIHNGISIQESNECAQLIGAKFTSHPPYTNLSFKISDPCHPITEGIEKFELEDEPYRYDIQGFLNSDILFEYLNEGKYWPGAWAHNFGMGRVVYLMPGHNVSTFLHPVYRQIIQNSGRWASKRNNIKSITT